MVYSASTDGSDGKTLTPSGTPRKVKFEAKTKKKRRNTGARAEKQKPTTPVRDLFLQDRPEPEQGVADLHPLETWTQEQVLEWSQETLKKNHAQLVHMNKFDGKALHAINRQWLIKHQTKGKDAFMDALAELRTRLEAEAIRKQIQDAREELKRKHKGVRPAGADDFDDPDSDQEWTVEDQAVIEAKRRKWDEELRMPKSQRAWRWEKKIGPALIARQHEEETTKFRVMAKMAKFERTRLDDEKFIKRMQKDRAWFHLGQSEQKRRKNARLAMSHLKKTYAEQIKRELRAKPGICWGPIINPNTGQKMNGYAYIRDKWAQKKRAQKRSKSFGPCKPKLQLRCIRQRLPQDDEWKVRHLKKKLGSGVAEIDIVKVLVQEKGFLSAALQVLLRGSRRSGEDKEKIEKYKGFFTSRIRMFKYPKKLRGEEIEDLITSMEEQSYTKTSILTDGMSTTHLHILLEGRCVANKHFHKSGIDRTIFLRQYIVGNTFGHQSRVAVDIVPLGSAYIGRIPMETVLKYVTKEYIEQLVYQNKQDIISKFKLYERDNKLDLRSIMPVVKPLKVQPLKRTSSDQAARISLVAPRRQISDAPVMNYSMMTASEGSDEGDYGGLGF